MKPSLINGILQGIIGCLLVAFIGQVGYEYFFNKPEPVLLASWAYEPRNLAEAKGLAQEIVEAQVMNVERADDLITKAPGEPGGIDRIAVEVVTMKVNGAMKGRPGQEIQVFRTAGIPVNKRGMPPMSQAPPRPKGAANPPKQITPFTENMVNIHDDVEYKPGERYMMFLREGPNVRMKGRVVPTKSLLNPSTRFRIGKDNRVMPTIPDTLGQPFKGKPLQNFKTDIQQAVERVPVPGKLQGQLILPALKIKPGRMPGGIRPRGIEGAKGHEDMEIELGEIEVPTEGTAPEYQ
jgi:hypothetical protein